MSAKPPYSVHVAGTYWLSVRIDVGVKQCEWAFCLKKAAEFNADETPLKSRDIAPADVLQWMGQWAIDDAVRAIRPVEGCECPLCSDARTERPQ